MLVSTGTRLPSCPEEICRIVGRKNQGKSPWRWLPIGVASADGVSVGKFDFEVDGRDNAALLKMPMDIVSRLPAILPKTIAWAAQQVTVAENAGVPLDAEGLRIARAVGVHEPERIRVVVCEEIPMPTDPELREAAAAAGLLAASMAGLTLDHAVFIRSDCDNAHLLAHESRHVYQVEQAGGLALFLAEYLGQLLQYGYRDAPLEVDARVWEGAGQ